MSTDRHQLRQIIQSLFDGASAAVCLLFLIPVFAAVALLIVCDDGPPVFFTQLRIGRKGRPFHIWKFRTMAPDLDGAAITVAGDPRITPVGAFLRRYKLDELPQLMNVLKGEMGLIGPRPELPAFVDYDAPLWRSVLSVRPGITDPAALVYRNEECLLGSSPNPLRLYSDTILPRKLILSVRYIRARSIGRDLRLVLLTLQCVIRKKQLELESIHTLLRD